MLEKLKEEWRSSPRLGRVVAATLDVAFYLLHLTTHKPASVYDLAILLLLDSYIKAGHDKTGRMKMFYHLPKVFLMSPGQSLVGFVFALALIASHVREIWPLKNTYIFFLSITAGVSISSTGITRMLALGLVAFIMASYMYIWEADQLALTPSKPAEQLSESDVNEETQKDNAIAENLITKLKKLKVALIIENERPKLNVMEEEVEGLRRGRSVESKF